MARGEGEEKEQLDLSKAAETLLDECRMVLPGIQALFGFQLIAVFNQRFSEDLTDAERCVHLAAISLVAIAVALVMTPAAYHRHRGARVVTDTFVAVSSRLLVTSMVPLAAGLSLDFYIITRLILDAPGPAMGAAILVFGLMMFAWFVFPRMGRLHRLMTRSLRP